MATIEPNITDYLGIPFPAENADPFYDEFEAMVKSMEQVMLYSKMFANMFVTGGGNRVWNGTSGLLTWTAPFNIVVPHWGRKITVQYGPDGLLAAAGLQDGQCLVVEVPLAMSANVTTTFSVASQLNANEHKYFVVGARMGSKLYLRNIGEMG